MTSPAAGCSCPIHFRLVDGLPTADQRPPEPSALELASRRTTLATTGVSTTLADTALAGAAGTAPAAALVVDSSLALAQAPAQRPASPALATDPAGLLAEQLSASGGVVVVGPGRSLLEPAGAILPRQPGRCIACQAPAALAGSMPPCPAVAGRQSGPTCLHARALASSFHVAPAAAKHPSTPRCP